MLGLDGSWSDERAGQWSMPSHSHQWKAGKKGGTRFPLQRGAVITTSVYSSAKNISNVGFANGAWTDVGLV